MPKRSAGLMLLPLVLLPSVPLAQPAPPRPAPAGPAERKPDPAFEAARAAFEALPEPERRAIQGALVWTGDFNAVDSGAFGRRTFEALTAWQRRGGAEPSGILDDRARAALLAAGAKSRDAAAFRLRSDRATGVAIGVPAKLLPREEAVANGTRWQSADGKITLETRALPPGEDLDATFERVSATTPDRKVTYRLKRPDFLVVSGETPTGKFFIRYAATPTGVRGFTVGYDKALAADVDRIVIAVANSFDPAPATAAPPAATPAGPATAGAPTPPPVAAPPLSPRTALAVGPNRAVTSAGALVGCAEPRVAGLPATVGRSQDGVAVLDVAGARFRPVAAAPAVPLDDAPLVAVAAAADGQGLAVTPARALAAGRIAAALQPGAAGAPVFDRLGRLAGLVDAYPAAPRLVAGVAPAASYALVPAAVLGSALPASSPRTEGERSTGEIAAAFGPSILAVTCGREGGPSPPPPSQRPRP